MSNPSTLSLANYPEVIGPFDHPVEIHFPKLIPQTKHFTRFAVRETELETTATDTFGWDTVFAIRIPDVNRAIAKSKASPVSLDLNLETSCSIKGTFGVWQVCRGGDGDLINMAIPITDGTLTWRGESYSLSGITAIIQVRLHFLSESNASEDQDIPQPNTLKNLVVRTTQVHSDAPPVNVEELRFLGQPPAFMVKSIMRGALQEWFIQHLQDFTHVFSIVSLNPKIDHDQFQWLAPLYTSYAYIDGNSEEESFLSVLCMTQRPNADDLTNQLSQTAIPKTSKAGFLISKTLFFEKMVFPALPRVFVGSVLSNFALSEDKTKITNTVEIPLSPVSHDGKSYYPKLEELKITLWSNEIQIDSHTQVELSPGIYGHLKSSHFVTLKLVNKNGSQLIDYEQSRPPIVSSPWTTCSPGIEILKIILEILAVIVVAILTVLTDGAALIGALVVVGLVFGLAIASPDIIAAVMKHEIADDVPAIDLLVLNTTNPIKWADSSDFKLNLVKLNGALQLGGDPSFAT